MNTKQLRQKILDLAIRGKLVPQDPNDEPASVLLERINIEKERLIKEGKIKATKEKASVDKSHYMELPSRWTVVPIREAFIINPRNVADDETIAAFVPMTLLDDGFSNKFTFQERLWGEIKSGFTHFQNNDVGLAKITPCLENRKSTVFQGLKNGIGAGTTELHIFRPIAANSVSPFYLLWFFKSEQFISSCIGAFSGAVGQQRVGKDHVAETLLPIPPLAEQHRIVVAVESAFAVIDEIERNKTDLQAVVATTKQKILSLAIQGKLVSQDPDDEPADVLLENIRTEREALIRIGKVRRDKNISSNTNFDNEIDFSNLPDSWVVCTLGELAQYKKGPFGSSITKAMFVSDSDSTVKVYEQKNAIQKDASLGNYFITQDKFEELKGFEVFERDIIVSCAGTIGETYVMPQGIRQGIINQALMKVSLYEKDITNFYLIYFDYVLKELAQKESKGTAIKNIPPFEILKQFPFPLPPLAEQKRIVAAIEAAVEELDEIMIMLK